MERLIKIHVEKLPEGFYLATTDDIQGLVAQGRTVAETLEIARDIARKLIEDQSLSGIVERVKSVAAKSQ
jgi:predicted RNase H-like HicB family nuclease